MTPRERTNAIREFKTFMRQQRQRVRRSTDRAVARILDGRVDPPHAPTINVVTIRGLKTVRHYDVELPKDQTRDRI